MKYLRGNYNRTASYRFDWPKILKAGCYTNTPMGPVAQSDGEVPAPRTHGHACGHRVFASSVYGVG